MNNLFSSLLILLAFSFSSISEASNQCDLNVTSELSLDKGKYIIFVTKEGACMNEMHDLKRTYITEKDGSKTIEITLGSPVGRLPMLAKPMACVPMAQSKGETVVEVTQDNTVIKFSAIKPTCKAFAPVISAEKIEGIDFKSTNQDLEDLWHDPCLALPKSQRDYCN
jgi:hypothetical protein